MRKDVLILPHFARLIAPLLGLLLLVAAPEGARAQGFQADFYLKVTGSRAPSESTGHLEYLDPTTVYLEILAPIHQKIWLQRGAVTLYYPDQNQVLRQPVQSSASTLPLESLSVGIHPLDNRNFDNAKLVARTRTREGKLMQHWHLLTPEGKLVGMIRLLEGPEGVERLELLNENEKLTTSYRFGPRTQVGALKIPKLIQVEYYLEDGKVGRSEFWKLVKLEPLPPMEARQVGKSALYPKDAAVQTFTF